MHTARHAISSLLQPRDGAADQQRGGGAKGGHHPHVDAPTRHALRALTPLLAPPPPPPLPPASPSPPSSLVYLLQKVGVPACKGPLWLELPGDVPLRQALSQIWLLEFPTLHSLPRAELEARGYVLATSAGPEAAMPDNKWL